MVRSVGVRWQPCPLVLVTALVARKNGWMRWVKPVGDWKFSDSWASNVTIGASALAVLFSSSDVAAAVNGEDATVAPTIVLGSALALVAVTAAPFLLKVFVNRKGQILTVAIAAAAALTLGGASLQGLVIVRQSAKLNVPDLAVLAWVVAIVYGILLAIYAVRTLYAIFTAQPGEASRTDASTAPVNVPRAAML